MSVPPAARPQRDRKILRMFVVPGLGLLGAWLDLYTAWTILTGISKMRSNYGEFASEYPLVAFFLRFFFSDNYRDIEQASGVFETAALLLLIFGLLGAIASILFVWGRKAKALAIVLMICGIAPMFHRAAEFMGLPMVLGGLLGLLVHNKSNPE